MDRGELDAEHGRFFVSGELAVIVEDQSPGLPRAIGCGRLRRTLMSCCRREA